MPKNKEIRRAVIYARYSSDKQTEQSIEGQIADCTAFANRNGLKVVDTYIDRAFTATTDRRPAFQKMIKDSDQRTFDIIIVWKLDRFARNRYDSAVYKRRLKTNGVQVLSAMENITDSPEGVLMESVLEGFAEYFSKDLSQKIKRGMRETAKKHKITNRLPFGYCKAEDGTYKPDELTAPAVKKMFMMYADGEKKSDIADYLNKNGYKTSWGNSFTFSSICQLVQNTRYIGRYSYGGVEYVDERQRIVSDELFNRVQLTIQANRHTGATHKTKERYILSGKLYCGCCGRTLHGECGTSKSGVKHYYYVCNNKHNAVKCTRGNIKKDVIETYVLSKIKEFLSDESIFNDIIDRIMKYQASNADYIDGLKDLEARLKSTESKRLNLLTAIEQGIITPSTKARLTELENLKVDLEYKIASHKARNFKFTKSQLKSLFNSMNIENIATWQEKQAIIKNLIERIYVWKDKILLLFNYGNNFNEPEKREKDIQDIIKTVTENKCSVTVEYGGPSRTRT